MGKKVLITGGTKGIGLAVAQKLWGKGYEVIATYAKDAENARKLEEKSLNAKAEGSLQTLPLDITVPESAYALAQELTRRNFVPDVLILNAGITYRGSLSEIPDQEWYAVFEANIHFSFKLIKALLPHMLSGSAILFTGSMMARYPHSMSLAYGVTKSAVHAMVENLVKELEPFGIRVAGIAPGFVDTEWQQSKSPQIRKSIEGKLAHHRFMSPEEVADAYLSLIENEYFNGDILTISGGYAYK